METTTIRVTLLVTEKARCPKRERWRERRKGRRKRRIYFPLLFPSPSIPLHPARHDDEDGDSVRRGVAQHGGGAAWRGAMQRGAANKSCVRNLGAYLHEGFHGALGYVQERGPTPQISPLIHGGRRVDQEYYYGHLREDGDGDGDGDNYSDGDGGDGGGGSGGGNGGDSDSDSDDDDEVRIALARRNVLVLVY